MSKIDEKTGAFDGSDMTTLYSLRFPENKDFAMDLLSPFKESRILNGSMD